jgi:uncharacterized protein (DUF58 family)
VIAQSMHPFQDLGKFLNRDFLPGVTRYVRWARTPLGCLGLAALASGLCGTFLHPQGFVVLFGVLAVTALGLVWPWMGLVGLGGTLAFDRRRSREGERIAVRLALRNRMPWGAWGVSVKGGFLGAAGEGRDEGPVAGLAFVPGWRTTEATAEFVPGCRGEYPRCPPRVACGFPLGLWEASRPLAVPESLLVWPRTFPVAPVPEADKGHAAVGLAVRDRAGNWGDPLGVRPYRRGDSLRRVHWGQTARHGALIVCEVQSNSVPRVQIVLDAHPASHAGSGPDGSREWGVRVAASLAEGWISQGAEVELVLDGGLVPSRGRTAKARSAVMLDALSRLKPDTATDLVGLLDLPECRRFGRGLRVVVTTDVGLRGLTGAGPPTPGNRFVVLKAGAFGGDPSGGDSTPLPAVPWVWIDGPGRVLTCIRRAGKEVHLGS